MILAHGLRALAHVAERPHERAGSALMSRVEGYQASGSAGTLAGLALRSGEFDEFGLKQGSKLLGKARPFAQQPLIERRACTF